MAGGYRGDDITGGNILDGLLPLMVLNLLNLDVLLLLLLLVLLLLGLRLCLVVFVDRRHRRRRKQPSGAVVRERWIVLPFVLIIDNGIIPGSPPGLLLSELVELGLVGMPLKDITDSGVVL